MRTSHLLNGFGGILRCESCKRTAALGDTTEYLESGWPTCCGYTMRWWTQRQIDAGELAVTERREAQARREQQ